MRTPLVGALSAVAAPAAGGHSGDGGGKQGTAPLAHGVSRASGGGWGGGVTACAQWASIGRRVLVQVAVACGWHAHSARASDGAIANVGLSMVVRLCTICVVAGCRVSRPDGPHFRD